MKKLTTSILFLFVVLAAGAQTKATKTNVLGKWMIATVEIPGQVYYSIDKDSLAIADIIKATMDEAQLTTTSGILKQQLAMFSKVTFQFNANGKTEMTDPTGAVEQGTYVMDEKNATITSTTIIRTGEKNTGTLTKVKLLNPNSLEFYTADKPGGQEVHLVLKKTK